MKTLDLRALRRVVAKLGSDIGRVRVGIREDHESCTVVLETRDYTLLQVGDTPQAALDTLVQLLPSLVRVA